MTITIPVNGKFRHSSSHFTITKVFPSLENIKDRLKALTYRQISPNIFLLTNFYMLLKVSQAQSTVQIFRTLYNTIKLS